LFFFSDYQAKPELDRYEQDGLDDENQEELSYNARRDVNMQLDEEDRLLARSKGRVPGALQDDFDNNEYSENGVAQQLRMERMRQLRGLEADD
jgi:DNA replication licensing factor MCM2